MTGSSGDSVVCTDEFEVFLLSGESGKFTLECDTLSDGSFVEYQGSSNKVYLTTSSSEADTWTFAYSSNKFRIQSGNVTGRYLQYNSGSPRFACYTGSQQYLDVYRYREVSYDEIKVTGELEKTEYLAGDTFDPTGIEVHGYIGGVDQGAIDLSKITWEPSVLDAGTTSVDAVFANTDGSELRCTVGGITVQERQVTDIQVTVGEEIRYEVGDTRAYEGVTVTAVYADGSTSDVTAAATFDPAKGTVVGIEEEGQDVEVHVTYLSFTKSFSYSVSFSPSLEYTAVQSDFGSSGNIKSSASIGDLDWTVSFSDNGTEYLAFEGNKGVQFGSSKNHLNELRLRSPLFVGSGKSLITEISVNASTGSDGTAKLCVYVGGELIGNDVLTNDSADYAYHLEEGRVGHVEIAFVPSSGSSLSKALYLKSITINGTSVTGTGDDAAIAALTNLEAVDGCAYSTPEEIANLESIVDEYDSLCADYPAFAAAMLDDYESGDVAHANGMQKDYVAAGEKAESIRGRITAPEAQPFFSFQGEGGDRMNWAIAGASLGIALLGAAGYLFYRKKRAVR